MAQHQRKGGGAARSGGRGGFFWVLALVAVVGIGAILWAVMGGGSGSAATAPVEMGSIEDAEAMARAAQPVRKGDPSAPVQIVEFADYQCPGCAHFAMNVARPLQSYIDAGQVQLVFYDFPLNEVHPNAFLAARAARCAGEQGSYWEYHDALFSRQSRWSTDRRAADTFVEYASDIGLESGPFESCLRSDRFADVVTANTLVGERLGVRSTPTVYVNGRIAGEAWGDAAAMRRLIEAELSGVGGPAEPVEG